MTNDSAQLSPDSPKKSSKCKSDPHDPRPFKPVLKMDVATLDKSFPSTLNIAEISSGKCPLTMFAILYDKVSNIQKDEEKRILVYQKLCESLEQAEMVKLLPQIDTLRVIRQRYSDYLDELIYQISSDIDKQNPALKILADDLFPPSNEPTNSLVHSHQLLHSTDNYQTSRLSDFVNFGLIEKGGFGSVYKMKNLTDKCFYAIKFIPFKSRNQTDATKIMKEVYFYANIPSHQNIVSYKGSWLDYYVKNSRESRKSTSSVEEFVDTQSTESSSSKESSKESKGSPTSQEDSEPSQSDECGKTSSSECLSVEFSSQASSLKSRKDEIGEASECCTESTTVKTPLFYCVVCIQMELCSFNLRAWLNQRNDDLYLKKVEFINYDEAIDIFIQIVRGIQHLHSHNLIHRDIKPHNILFSKAGVVKIGDFGLTTINDQLDSANDETLSWSGKVQKRTRGLGTSSYSAPEQQKSSWYDSKTDIYSLGLIAFELLYPLTTDMERSDRFDKLRGQKQLPEELTKLKPFADLILEMVQNDPEARPSAINILQRESILRHGWKVNQDQPTYQELLEMNKCLNNRIRQLEEIVESLQKELALRDDKSGVVQEKSDV